MHLQFVGCGDAFGSGGRFNTCFHVTSSQTNFLIDCGASSMVALRRFDVDIHGVDIILVTHFHGDHFGGIPFLMLDAQLVSHRTRPLIIAGPRGLPDRYARAMDVAFPSSPQQPTGFQLVLQEIEIGIATQVGAINVTAYPVRHTEAAGPCVGYRINVDDKVLAYSGDTEWTESLIDIGHDADLFICEAYTRTKPIRTHTNVATLEAHLEEIKPKRLILTHMSADMLWNLDEVPHEKAADGLTVTI
jgi:ribonuclease BN (tRNA processing enzyme)